MTIRSGCGTFSVGLHPLGVECSIIARLRSQALPLTIHETSLITRPATLPTAFSTVFSFVILVDAVIVTSQKLWSALVFQAALVVLSALGVAVAKVRLAGQSQRTPFRNINLARRPRGFVLTMAIMWRARTHGTIRGARSIFDRYGTCYIAKNLFGQCLGICDGL